MWLYKLSNLLYNLTIKGKILMKLYESSEMYLETILGIQKKKGNVRSVDIVGELGHAKSSVSESLKRLKEKNLVSMDAKGIITLTDEGKAIADKIFEMHNVLFEFLCKIGVSENVAENDACRIEHVISKETFDVIKNFIEN